MRSSKSKDAQCNLGCRMEETCGAQKNHGHTPVWWEIVVVSRFEASATISLRNSTSNLEKSSPVPAMMSRKCVRVFVLSTPPSSVRGLTRKVRVWQTTTEDNYLDPGCLSRRPLRSHASKIPLKLSKAEKSSTFSSGREQDCLPIPRAVCNPSTVRLLLTHATPARGDA